MKSICLVIFAVVCAAEAATPLCSSYGTEYLEHPTDCTKYYKCWWGDQLLKSCPAGLHFDITTENCVQKSLAKCGNFIPATTPKPQIKPTEAKCSPYGNEFLVHPTDCSRYYKCFSGERIDKFCPDGQYFRLSSGNCVSKHLVQCGPAPPPPKQPTRSECLPSENGFLEHPTQCDRYFQCKLGNRIDRFCPDGQYFRLSTGTCVSKRLVQCDTEKKW